MQLSPEALSLMSAYDYPGNVRELKNLVERLAILCPGPIISAPEAAELMPRARGRPALTPLPDAASPAEGLASASATPASEAPKRGSVDRPFRDQVEDAERQIILNALAFTRDNVTEAARLLDLERGHFYKKMKALGLKRGGGEKEGG